MILIEDNIDIKNWKGHVTLTVFDQNDHIIPEECQEFDNMLVTAGKELIADAIRGAASISYCGVGSGQTAVTVSDTDLESIIGARKLITTSARSGTVVVFSTFFSAVDNNGTWKEAGLFSASTAGTMLCHALFVTPFVKTNLKRCQLDWTVTIS